MKALDGGSEERLLAFVSMAGTSFLITLFVIYPATILVWAGAIAAVIRLIHRPGRR